MRRVAAVQMASGPNVSANLIEAGRLIARAVKNHDAKLIVLPVFFAIMGLSEQDKVKIREQDGKGLIQDFLANQAAKHGVWLVGGTIPIVAEADNKVRAACLLMDNRGRRVVRYDKMHMFDVHISETGENYAESQTIEAGDAIVVLDAPFGKLGLAVCYDLRFPELFRRSERRHRASPPAQHSPQFPRDPASASAVPLAGRQVTVAAPGNARRIC